MPVDVGREAVTLERELTNRPRLRPTLLSSQPSLFDSVYPAVICVASSLRTEPGFLIWIPPTGLSMTHNYSLCNRPPPGNRRVDIRTMMEQEVALASDIVGQAVFGTHASRRNWVPFGSSNQPARVCFGSIFAVHSVIFGRPPSDCNPVIPLRP